MVDTSYDSRFGWLRELLSSLAMRLVPEASRVLLFSSNFYAHS